MNDLPTYQLIRLSAKICRHCNHFRTTRCPVANVKTRKEIRCYNWSSLSACDSWTPNARSDEAMQILTWRRLEGQDITDFLDKSSDGENDGKNTDVY